MVFKEGATWKVREDRSAKEGWGRVEAMRKIREGEVGGGKEYLVLFEPPPPPKKKKNKPLFFNYTPEKGKSPSLKKIK